MDQYQYLPMMSSLTFLREALDDPISRPLFNLVHRCFLLWLLQRTSLVHVFTFRMNRTSSSASDRAGSERLSSLISWHHIVTRL
jgi:hypothetical protein